MVPSLSVTNVNILLGAKEVTINITKSIIIKRHVTFVEKFVPGGIISRDILKHTNANGFIQ